MRIRFDSNVGLIGSVIFFYCTYERMFIAFLCEL